MTGLQDAPSGALMPAAVWLVLATALLWLGREVVAAGRGRRPTLARGLAAAGTVLVACALWWPSHGAGPDGQEIVWFGRNSPVGWVLALAWAVSGVGIARHLRRDTVPVCAGLALVALLMGYLYAAVALPRLWHNLPGDPLPWLVAALLLTTAGLAAMHVDAPEGRAGLLIRAAGTGAVAVAAALQMLMDPSAVSLRAMSLPEGLLLVALLAATSLLLLGLRSQANDDDPPRPVPAQAASRDVTTLDALTQLPNRVYFEKKLDKAARMCVAKSRRMALLFIDLDGFKPVNDTFGHQCGDQVLEQVGKRLRTLSGRRGLSARVGGDEFLMLLSDIGSDESVALAAKRLITQMSLSYKVQGREVNISCSVGIAMYPDDGCDPIAVLIQRADAAMYAAKRAGGARHCFYTPALDADARASFDLLADLRQAVVREEFELHYQPKIDARTGKVTAAEGLLRWKHPTRGMLMPGLFIPVAERFGLINALGDWVITDACRQAREWRDKGLRMRVAINLSAHQMRQDDIVDRIATALRTYRIHASLLTCEITETAAMEDTRATQETFRRLGELGAHVSIDDFGTGYSSLAYLRKLPAEELKIDRSFVMDIEHSADARAVIKAVVDMAHALGKKVVAEGVENQRQQAVLVDLGCDELQGYLFARPMSARAILLWAMQDRRETAKFKASLFGETREASETELRKVRSAAHSAGSLR